MALLHVSVLLFAGLVDFLFSVDDGVAHAIFGVISLLSAPTAVRTPFSRDALKWLFLSPPHQCFSC